jgi:hypothetical protein
MFSLLTSLKNPSKVTLFLTEDERFAFIAIQLYSFEVANRRIEQSEREL